MAPRSSRFPKFGSWPAATRCRMNPSDAPSSRSRRTRGCAAAGGGTPRATGAVIPRGPRSVGTGNSPGPRSHRGTATDSTIDPKSSAAAARVPRLPNEYRSTATATSTAANTVVAVAPCRSRSAAPAPSIARNPFRLAHVTIAADAAPAAPTQASRRTLSQPGDSGSAASSSRNRISR